MTILKQLTLQNGDSILRLNFAWNEALKETLYPLHQAQFKLQKKHRAADPEPQPFDFARAKKDRPTALRMQTEARLREFLAAGLAPGVMSELSSATRPPTLRVVSAKLNRVKSAISTLAVEVAYRPAGADKDRTMALLLQPPRQAARVKARHPQA